MTLATAGAVGASGIVLMGRDKTPPELTISDPDYTYSPEQSREEMLSGVSAADSKDGDVTDRIIIEKVSVNEAGTEAQITYVATDKSNNVTKAVRTAPCSSSGTTKKETIADEETSDTKEEDTETESTATPTDTLTPTEEADASQDEEEADVNPEAPVIKLTDSAVTVSLGERFSVLRYVKEITDDKDERSRLYNNIEVKGSVDTNKSGTYELQYFVTDSDGNRSADANLKVTVE